MTEMKNIVFKVETEYHLMLSIIIILRHFYNNNFSCYIFCDMNNKRLNYKLNEDDIPAKFIKIKFKLERIKKILDLKPDRFFFFQEIDAENIYLISKLYKSNCIISLVQDGLKPYVNYRKKNELLCSIRDTYKIYKELLTNGLSLNKIKLYWFYKYGKLSEINELWLTHPKAFSNKFEKKLVKIDGFDDTEIFKVLLSIFNFKDFDLILPKENIILYVNQPFWDPIMIEEELDFLRQLLNRFVNSYDIFIKLHPLTPDSTINKYKEMNLKIIEINVPAELLIANLKNSIIISGWSSALLFDNPKCNFYYNFPIYSINKILSQIAPTNPTNHIKIISSADEVYFKES